MTIAKLKQFDQVGRLTLLHKYYKSVGIKRPINQAFWYCICECGNTCLGRNLIYGSTNSCGCLQKESRTKNIMKAVVKKTKYSDEIKKSPLFKRWRSILNRTRYINESHHNYKNYKGKGITVCDEWRLNFYAFEAWAISAGFSQDLTIDRIDSSLGYFPENCRWLTFQDNVKHRDGKLETSID